MGERNDKILELTLNKLNEFAPYIMGLLIIVVFVLFIIVCILLKDVNKLEIKYRKFMKGTSKQNLEEMILEKLDSIEENKKLSQKALDECARIENEMNIGIQKVSIIRYKAFENVGSDLSFSIALLDNNNDGIILTGIYGRQDSTTYAKPVDKGISRYELSQEEIHVLNEAINK